MRTAVVLVCVNVFVFQFLLLNYWCKRMPFRRGSDPSMRPWSQSERCIDLIDRRPIKLRFDFCEFCTELSSMVPDVCISAFGQSWLLDARRNDDSSIQTDLARE